MTVLTVLQSTLPSFARPTKYRTKMQLWRFWRFQRLRRFWSWWPPPLNSTPLFRHADNTTSTERESTMQILLNTVGLMFFGLELAHLMPFRVTGLIPEIPDFGIRYRFAMSALFPSRNLAQKLSYAWCRRHCSSIQEPGAHGGTGFKRVQQFAPH